MVSIPHTPLGQAIPIASSDTAQNVSIGASSTQSSAVGAGTEAVRLCSDVTCWYATGSDPTAATDASGGSRRLPADVVEIVGVPKSGKIAVIQDSTSGTLNIAEAI